MSFPRASAGIALKQAPEQQALLALLVKHNGLTDVAVPLTPAQWLPKPATRWMPQLERPLRGTWSPRRGWPLCFEFAAI